MPFPNPIFPLNPDDIPAKGYDLVFTGVSPDIQNPLGLDQPLVINFGPQSQATDNSFTLGADGVLTFNEAGYYAIKTRYRFAREGASGTSNLFNYAEASTDGGLTWTILGSVIDVTLRDSSVVNIFFDLSIIELPAGIKIRALFARSSTGSNFGGLLPSQVSAPLSALGITDAPSSQLTVYKIPA
jgi:hypothetical protein